MIEAYSPYFGPLILKFKCPEHIVQSIQDIGDIERKRNPKNRRIEGEFLDERPADLVALRWRIPIEKRLNEYIDFYLNEAGEKSSYDIESLWVNYMRKGEYQPHHNHSGDLSYNLIVQQPEGLGESGTLYFSYGEKQAFNKTLYRVVPERGDLIIFPSWVTHYVYPTTTESERITAAGNILLR
mgnify:FL=1|tara:strand:- start:1156 stop:1704 length:549 start_codon:yes stop_codon:yes gene_type:complete